MNVFGFYIKWYKTFLLDFKGFLGSLQGKYTESVIRYAKVKFSTLSLVKLPRFSPI